MAFVQFAFVKFLVQDLDAATRFYERALDLHATRTIETDRVTEILMMPRGESGGFFLVLCKEKHAPAAVVGNTHGPLAIYVASVDETVARTVAEGATLKRGPFDVGSARVAFVDDPEHHELEFIERRA